MVFFPFLFCFIDEYTKELIYVFVMCLLLRSRQELSGGGGWVERTWRKGREVKFKGLIIATHRPTKTPYSVF